jgi:cytochrome c6
MMNRRSVVGLVVVLAIALSSPLLAADGKALYESKCAMCHGKDGVAKPAGKGSRNFNDPAFQKAATSESIEKITAEGKGKMPAYRSKLKEEQIKSIAAHIKTLGS